MKKVIFTDFDGTVTKVDSCFAMVKSLARDGWQELNKKWEERKLSTLECANQTFGLFDANLDDIKNLMDTIEIDEYFREFLDLCRSKDYEIYILSDGYDFNIQAILNRYNINIKYFANKLIYGKDNRFRAECPYQSSSCQRCGTCKTELIKQLTTKGSQIIYIGDGHSDMCAAENADVVFAKDVLYRYCREKGINAIEFKNFKDIITSGLI